MALVLVLLLVFLSIVRASAGNNVVTHQTVARQVQQGQKQAFVTMLYTIRGDMYVDGFEIGVRVLGQSLREVHTDYDYVVLCTDDVPVKVRRVLANDGWIVKPFDKLQLPSDKFNENTFKLNIFKLTEYRRIVFLDADVIVMQNIDKLFKCGSFCASFRHSDLFNSGVMVVKPSVDELNKILHSMQNVTSIWYHKTYGDQVVLNHHFKDLKKATMFDPDVKHNEVGVMRLSTGYNADVGIYYLNNGWSFPLHDLKIIHYTMGIVKPMLWWTYPLFDLNWKWDELRGRLPSKFTEPSMFAFEHWLPAILLVMLFVSFRVCNNLYKSVYRLLTITHVSMVLVPGSYGWFVVVFPVVIQVLSLLFAFSCIPSIMRPRPAWWLYSMWNMFYMILFYSLYCRYLYKVGRSHGTRFISLQGAKVETVIHLTVYLLILLGIFYIPYAVINFHIRVVSFLSWMLISYVQGYISGRRVLKIWFGHYINSSGNILPCYSRLESPVNNNSLGSVQY